MHKTTNCDRVEIIQLPLGGKRRLKDKIGKVMGVCYRNWEEPVGKPNSKRLNKKSRYV